MHLSRLPLPNELKYTVRTACYHKKIRNLYIFLICGRPVFQKMYSDYESMLNFKFNGTFASVYDNLRVKCHGNHFFQDCVPFKDNLK